MNIPKEKNKVATKKGELLLIDISWVKTVTIADDRYWLLIMDEYTHYLWSYLPKVIPLILDLQLYQDTKDKYI
jgi:hypothetical protein